MKCKLKPISPYPTYLQYSLYVLIFSKQKNKEKIMESNFFTEAIKNDSNSVVHGYVIDILNSDFCKKEIESLTISYDETKRFTTKLNVYSVKKIKDGVCVGLVSLPNEDISVKIFISTKDGKTTFDAYRLDAPIEIQSKITQAHSP